MLEVGSSHLNAAETRSHFALWAAMKSPLLIGTDLSAIGPEDLTVLRNEILLAFNQDPEIGAPAMPYKWGTNPDWTFNASFPAEYWSGNFHDPQSGSEKTLVLVLNVYDATQTRSVLWADVPQLSSTRGVEYSVTDGWTGQFLGCYQDFISVPVGSHDTALLVIGAVCSATDL